MALAGEREDDAVMDESIDDGGGSHLVGKDLRPLLERQVRRERDAAAFVPLRDELKEQVGCLSFERDVSEFVDEQQVNAIEVAIVPFEGRRSLGGAVKAMFRPCSSRPTKTRSSQRSGPSLWCRRSRRRSKPCIEASSPTPWAKPWAKTPVHAKNPRQTRVFTGSPNGIRTRREPYRPVRLVVKGMVARGKRSV
jgi:hypothetical protein